MTKHRPSSTVPVYRVFNHRDEELAEPVLQYVRKCGPPPVGGRIVACLEPPTHDDVVRWVEEMTADQRERFCRFAKKHTKAATDELALETLRNDLRWVQHLVMLAKTDDAEMKRFFALAEACQGTGVSPLVLADVERRTKAKARPTPTD